MAEPSEILREEHEVIEHLLHVLEAMGKEVERGSHVPKSDLEAALEVVVGFADECHHAKEEKALFPILAKVSPKEGAFLVHRLEGDHKAARQIVRAMRDSIPGVDVGEGSARATFAKSAKTYAVLLREHIKAETNRLLPLTDAAIPAAQRKELGEEFERIEREETGAGVHEKYEGTIHLLADKYIHRAARVP
ncbi:MAG TPA: hemerythrin domain-containing protein [Thermoplasmata archaeon]|jgi:hemerythrin-like domain-containing protein